MNTQTLGLQNSGTFGQCAITWASEFGSMAALVFLVVFILSSFK
jgi:hypothetical protein